MNPAEDRLKARPLTLEEIGALREKVAHFCMIPTRHRSGPFGATAAPDRMPCTMEENHEKVCSYHPPDWEDARWLATIDDLREKINGWGGAMIRLVDSLSGRLEGETE
jgi:hypothetical protein